MGKKQNVKKVHIKQLRKEVQEKLAVVLADYKNALSGEKYSKTLKKASKLFVRNFEKVNEKEKESDLKENAIKIQQKAEETHLEK